MAVNRIFKINDETEATDVYATRGEAIASFINNGLLFWQPDTEVDIWDCCCDISVTIEEQ
jgi:hypothetical protein